MNSLALVKILAETDLEKFPTVSQDKYPWFSKPQKNAKKLAKKIAKKLAKNTYFHGFPEFFRVFFAFLRSRDAEQVQINIFAGSADL